MPAPQGFTGQGATVVFGTTAFAAAYREIGQLKKTIPAIDSTTLDVDPDDMAQKIPGDCPEAEPIRCRVRFKGSQAQPALRVVETITITLPKEVPTAASGGIVAGTGFLTSWTMLPNLQRNQLNEAELEFCFDGGTGPAYTPEPAGV